MFGRTQLDPNLLFRADKMAALEASQGSALALQDFLKETLEEFNATKNMELFGLMLQVSSCLIITYYIYIINCLP